MRSKLAATFGALLLLCLFLATSAFSQTAPESVDYEMVEKIKAEGLERSQIMDVISYLTDVHGPRLTGSPITKSAANWTLSKLEEWGLENGHTESWGPFGRGWTLEGCMVNMVEPSYAPLIAHVKAWSPSTTRTIKAEPIYLDAETTEDLEKYRGKLGRGIVLISPPRDLTALFDPPATRRDTESLLRLANAQPPTIRGRESGGRGAVRSGGRGDSPAPAAAQPEESAAAKPEGDSAEAAAPVSILENAESPAQADKANAEPAPTPGEGQAAGAKAAELPASEPAQDPKPAQATPAAATPPQPRQQDPRAAFRLLADKWQMAYDEGASVVLEPGRGDGGNVFVASVTMPRQADDQGAQGNRYSRGPRPWATEATNIIPQAVLAAEHYNRLVRMIQKGAAPTLEVDILCSYHEDDPNSFNIIAEIPGSDLADEVVMLGGHFDSWQSGTGATDNAVGCGVAMEAVRILKAIDARPRRTIRLALWTGEEQGLLGSRAYVSEHFGNVVYEDESQDSGEQRESRGRRQAKYELKPQQEKISAYYNLDNGTGKIRGIYLQGNEQLRPIFRSWLTPFEDMDASTISVTNTGGTDHLSFDSIGIPGFQFIQDPLEYDTRTHHSSMDVFDRIQADDVKQAAIIMASFVYHTAMRDEQLPRKRLPGPVVRQSTPTETEPAQNVSTTAEAASQQ